MNIIEIRGVTKTLQDKTILDTVNLSIRQGEIIALVGPSGSGKSTLLRCMNRLLEPDHGSIIFKGKKISTLPPANLRRSLALVHQESIMFPGTVLENIGYGPMLTGNKDTAHWMQCLSDAGLTADFAEKNAEKLSGGEKKRVALARALAVKPNALLLDEPTAGVDPKNVKKVEQTIVNLSKNLGLTVIWVTHDVSQAQRVSQRIANLKEGSVTQLSATKEFKWEGAY